MALWLPIIAWMVSTHQLLINPTRGLVLVMGILWLASGMGQKQSVQVLAILTRMLIIILLFFSTAIMCSPLGVLANSRISYAPDTSPPYNYNTTATYSCSLGYSISGMQTRRCAENNIWTGEQPSCVGMLFKPSVSGY